jgi:hypothetical protein
VESFWLVRSSLWLLLLWDCEEEDRRRVVSRFQVDKTLTEPRSRRFGTEGEQTVLYVAAPVGAVGGLVRASLLWAITSFHGVYREDPVLEDAADPVGLERLWVESGIGLDGGAGTATTTAGSFGVLFQGGVRRDFSDAVVTPGDPSLISTGSSGVARSLLSIMGRS